MGGQRRRKESPLSCLLEKPRWLFYLEKMQVKRDREAATTEDETSSAGLLQRKEMEQLRGFLV
ncbi:hypothetical protein TorRG33x02_172570, partial [Trema orientale]